MSIHTLNCGYGVADDLISTFGMRGLIPIAVWLTSMCAIMMPMAIESRTYFYFASYGRRSCPNGNRQMHCTSLLPEDGSHNFASYWRWTGPNGKLQMYCASSMQSVVICALRSLNMRIECFVFKSVRCLWSKVPPPLGGSM